MKTYSQHGEDLYVVRHFAGKHGGTFIDIGAYDGIGLSNTALLELEYGWTGVLVEPIREVLDRIEIRRPNSIIVAAAVHPAASLGVPRGRPAIRTTAPFMFQPGANMMLSGCDYDPRHQDRVNRENARDGVKTEMRTVEIVHPMRVMKMIEGGPVDFLSIDTEGNELDILQAIDWDWLGDSSKMPRLICVENNFQEDHQRAFLESAGYRRIRKGMGACNDFYMPKDERRSFE